ncbi:unnamed protein product, partial [Staurois parvus]
RPPLGVPPLSANPFTDLRSVSSTPLCQSLHRPPLGVLHPSLPIPSQTSARCPPPLSANPFADLPLSSLHPSLPIPSQTSAQCPPPLSANPSTGLRSVSPPLSANPSLTDLRSVSSTPLCQSLHRPPLSVLHPSL